MSWGVLAVCVLAGCAAPVADGPQSAAPKQEQTQRVFTVRHLTFEQCGVFLGPLGLRDMRREPAGDVLVVGTPEQVERVAAILDVVDGSEAYGIERLGPASGARTLPSNGHIALALGDIDIGTFHERPINDGRARGIIDVQGDSVLAFLPVRYRDRLHRLLANDEAATGGADRGTAAQAAGGDRPRETAVPSTSDEAQSPTVVTLAEMAGSSPSENRDQAAVPSSVKAENATELPRTVTVSLTKAVGETPEAPVRTVTDKTGPANGEDVLAMTLPETITVIQLLDLVGKHVGLDFIYDPQEIKNQPVALKLHGTLQGEMRVKNLYAVLETVLEFMNLAMIRREGNHVAIVPIEKALQTQPELVASDSDGVSVGDTVVTRVFNIRYVDTAAVVTLLQDMKLSVAATALDNANLLLVTCSAGRMNRVERLVAMIDSPGRPAECRFRRLSYVRAAPLIAKIRTLAQELDGIAVSTGPTPAPASTPAKPAAVVTAAPAKPPTARRSTDASGRRPVYLDSDERTNRILMVGFEEELTLLEELIDILDVAQEDTRSAHIYAVKHLNAQQALEKLEKLEVFKSSPRGSGPAEATATSSLLTEQPLVAVLETTNQLVVKAAPDQHARIVEFLRYVDVAPTDTRTIAAYKIQYIDVQVAKETLEQLELVSVDSGASSFVPGPNQPATTKTSQVPVAQSAGNPLQRAPMVVSESTKTLLVKATPEQHARIAKIVQYIDRHTPEEEVTYQVYPLESSSPDHLAELLEQLVQERKRDEDGKVESVTPRTPEQIAIVPDPNTFSLIVYATQKNHRWIEGLIARLDKRRPQVLIDVTLVEITRTDTFEYDLSLVAAANGAVTGNLVIDPIQGVDSGSRLEGGFNLLDSNGNPTGRTRAFYSDQHVQALLTAIQQKNYGRVLAKPKVLVDDGRKGQIVTTEATTYVRESIQIPQTGTPITTREFTPIEASIELQITPHISEGDLLRLDVFMSRDDFGSRPLSGAPPDKATSKITTTVFVPDDRTVILGGLVKLNQSKGGSKVPILGDIPLVGAVFRSVNNSDIERKLYVFLKANIVRPSDGLGLTDLRRISEEHREAFERSEAEFQEHETIPGISPKPMPPDGVLRDYK